MFVNDGAPHRHDDNETTEVQDQLQIRRNLVRRREDESEVIGERNACWQDLVHFEDVLFRTESELVAAPLGSFDHHSEHLSVVRIYSF